MLYCTATNTTTIPPDTTANILITTITAVTACSSTSTAAFESFYNSPTLATASVACTIITTTSRTCSEAETSHSTTIDGSLKPTTNIVKKSSTGNIACTSDVTIAEQ